MSRIGFINKWQVLPEDYRPTKYIEVCGNKISDYKFLISDGGFYPILIGEGKIPRIWLFTKNQDFEAVTLVEDNVSYLGQVRVEVDKIKKTIQVKDLKSKTQILKLEYHDKVKITQLDLRPLGYNVFGDEKEWHIGNSRLINNSFSNVYNVIGFGEDPKERADD